MAFIFFMRKTLNNSIDDRSIGIENLEKTVALELIDTTSFTYNFALVKFSILFHVYE